MNIQTIVHKLLTDDIELKGTLKTIVFQEMLYPGMCECRCFIDNGDVYSCLYEDGDKITPFVLVPPQEKK